jgi:hypothetical protein
MIYLGPLFAVCLLLVTCLAYWRWRQYVYRTTCRHIAEDKNHKNTYVVFILGLIYLMTHTVVPIIRMNMNDEMINK